MYQCWLCLKMLQNVHNISWNCVQVINSNALKLFINLLAVVLREISTNEDEYDKWQSIGITETDLWKIINSLIDTTRFPVYCSVETGHERCLILYLTL